MLQSTSSLISLAAVPSVAIEHMGTEKTASSRAQPPTSPVPGKKATTASSSPPTPTNYQPSKQSQLIAQVFVRGDRDKMETRRRGLTQATASQSPTTPARVLSHPEAGGLQANPGNLTNPKTTLMKELEKVSQKISEENVEETYMESDVLTSVENENTICTMELQSQGKEEKGAHPHHHREPEEKESPKVTAVPHAKPN